LLQRPTLQLSVLPERATRGFVVVVLRFPGAACDDPGVSVESSTRHWIALDGAVNARAVVPGVLLRADNLQSLSARDVRRLVADEALEVVLDLRTDVEVELEGPGPMTTEPAVRIEHRSLYPDSGGNTDLEAGTLKPWGLADEDESPDEPPVVRAYMSYLRRRPDSIVGSLRAIARADGAALVHCAAGKDRTGVVVAVALDAAGVDRDAIVGDYLASRERIQAIIARLLSSSTYRAELEGHDPQRLAPAPGTMERMLELVDERFGGTVAWLSAHGLGDADIQRLHRRLSPARAGAGRS
jgi:protein-tyrosine phosphatase